VIHDITVCGADTALYLCVFRSSLSSVCALQQPTPMPTVATLSPTVSLPSRFCSIQTSHYNSVCYVTAPLCVLVFCFGNRQYRHELPQHAGTLLNCLLLVCCFFAAFPTVDFANDGTKCSAYAGACLPCSTRANTAFNLVHLTSALYSLWREIFDHCALWCRLTTMLESACSTKPRSVLVCVFSKE
jgi:hypothetical protein